MKKLLITILNYFSFDVSTLKSIAGNPLYASIITAASSSINASARRDIKNHMNIGRSCFIYTKYKLLFLLILISLNSFGQLEKPAVFLSQIEMTPSGGQVYANFYWFNTNNASLTKTLVSFPSTGSYRFDLSAYRVAGASTISVLIDGVSKGTVSVNATAIAIYSLFIASITSGSHTVAIQLTNFASGTNHCRVGLIYFTRTALTTPYVYPALVPKTLTAGILTKEDFGGGRLRGFSLGSNGTNQAGETIASMTAMKATGANIARCFVEIERLSGDTYTFKANELTKLATTVSRGTSLGFYVVPVMFHDPSLNSDYWGTSASHIARRASIVSLWQTLATAYNGNATVAAYDLINEPRSNDNYAEVIRWQTDMVDAIRAIDANHVIAVECISNDQFAMMLPLGYSNIIYSPHGYSPLNITHQGVVGEPGANIRNKYPTITPTANQGVFGKTQLSLQHDNVRIMSRRFNVPVFIGEFSCVHWAPLNDAGEWSSTAWSDDNISLLEAEGWSWVYHNWARGGEAIEWDPEIPQTFYNGITFTSARPNTIASPSNASTAAPTIVMLEKWFGLSAGVPISGRRTYYLSSTGDDNNNGLSTLTPWKTIAKVNLMWAVFNPGDSILFKKNETFYGALNVNKSGTAAQPIVLSSYGTGAKPVLTSLLTLSGFTLTGTNRYESATTSALLSTVRVVLIDGVIYGMGRYPNENIANKGYLTFESFSGKTSITDNQLTTSPNNWAGAEAVVRTTNFSLEPRTILTHSGGTLTYAATVQAPTSNGYGYFIQNDLRTLDKYGEWYYTPGTKKLSVYLTSAASGHTIQVSSLTNTVTVDGPDYIVFDGLTVQGANDYEFLATNNTGLVIKNCDMLHSGIGAVRLTTSATTTLQNNTVTNSLMCGFNINLSNSTTITGNSFYNTYNIAGMGGIFNSENGNAVWTNGTNNTVQSNSFINSGSCPVNFRGTGVLVKNNFIDSFSFIKSDIGGIYTYIGAGKVTSNTASIIGNIILHGIGAPEGSPAGNSRNSGDGIYIDVAGANCIITGNYIAYCYKGIFCHAATKITIRDNTFFANRLFQTDITSRSGDPARQMVVKKNIMFANNSSQKAIELVSDANNLGLIGSIDSNWYVNFTGVNPFTTVNPGTTNQLFAAWKTATGYDLNSTERLITNLNVILPFYALAVNNVVDLTPYAWSDAKSASFNNSLTVTPYTSAVLLRDTTVNPYVPLPLEIVVINDSILCNGGSANVSVDGIGGTPPYSGTGNSMAAAGLQQYIITDAVGDKDTADILITEPTLLSASASVGTITQFNGSTTATVTASGGITPYEYSINNGPWRASNIFTIKAGTYTIRVRDANGCIVVITPFSVTQPSPGNNVIIKNNKHIYYNL